MAYKLIIFDLDGTLVDAYRAIERSFNYTMCYLGLPQKDPLTIRRNVGWGDENLLLPFIGKQRIKKGLRAYRIHHRHSLLKYSRLFPKVKILLRHLKKKGYRLAIASNRPTRFTHILLDHLGIRQFFDMVLCADKLKNIKPHPDILLETLNKLKIGKDEALYVGDMCLDVETGKKAGTATIAVATGSNTVGQLKKARPLKVIPQVWMLLDYIETPVSKR
jgi:HAD superfamily hydrolase (TIGR01509 family)